MNKEDVKKIQIKEVIKNHLSCCSDPSGEYYTHCNVDFILDAAFVFPVFDKEVTIDRIKMTVDYETTELHLANAEKTYSSLPITKILIHKIYDRVLKEQKEGVLRGWVFDDDILEMLRGERETSSSW